MVNNFYECDGMSYIEKYRYLNRLKKVIKVEITKLNNNLQDIDEELYKNWRKTNE